MAAPTRRRFLLASGAVAAALAGCSEGENDPETAAGDETETQSGNDVDTETHNGDESGTAELRTLDGDATLTLRFASRASGFETLLVDIDRIEFVGDTDTDNVVIQVDDTGLDLTSLPQQGTTYLDSRSFPSGSYTAANIHLTVQEAVRASGNS